MTDNKADIQAARLPADEIAKNFGDMHPPLSMSEALIEADRCYFCYDAPCTTACPTDIDIPQFIQKIRSGNVKGSAETILGANIMGGMCARVCPTEVLCEEACVRNLHEEKPVNIGLLQRFATDPIFDQDIQLFAAGESSGKRVAIVGAGPAGLSCAHRLSMLGHASVVFNRDAKAGGLNEYGIAAYKTINNFAKREVDYILEIGNIELKNGETMGKDFTLADLRRDFDAVFVGVGLADVNRLGLENEDADGIEDAVAYIANLRQARDKSRLPVGRRVIVIGGGMTAIDIAVQSKHLGAEQVDIFYRRGPENMGASAYEQGFALTNDVSIHPWYAPREILVNKRVTGMVFTRTELDANGRLVETGDTRSIDADVVFKAIGQTLPESMVGTGDQAIALQHGKLRVNESGATSLPGIWAGGDCAHGHDDLTVSAVQDGKVAAHSIDRWLRGEGADNG